MTSKKKPPAKPERPKTQRQLPQAGHELPIDWQIFVAEYFKDGNGVRAAKAAGKADSSAGKWAHTMLQRPQIKLALARLRDESIGKIKWEIEDSLRELAGVAMFDYSDFFDDLAKGKIRSADDIPPEVRRCVREIEMGSTPDGKVFVKKVRFYDRMQAIDMLNKHKGFYQADNSQKADGVAQLVTLLQARQGGGLVVRK